MWWLLLVLPVVVQAQAPLRVEGLVAAVFTPLDGTFALDVTIVPQQWAYLRATNVSWVFVAGTTGESLSLTTAERKALLEAWCSQTDAKVIAHVGSNSMEDAKDLARHAERVGARGIAAMPPSYFKPATVEALAMTTATICGEAPTIPCYYYHIPSMTGVATSVLDLIKALETLKKVDNFAGVKYTGLMTAPGYKDMLQVLAYAGGKYEVLAGREEMMLESVAVGVTGHVGSQFNVFGDLYNALLLGEGRQLDLQLQGIDILDAAQAGASKGGLNAHKRFMTFAGVPVGDARLPFVPFDDDADTQLRAAFDALCRQYPDLYACRRVTVVVTPGGDEEDASS
eukprot:CAMPEP_0118898222 /NCGR_PEP_ID=MMETSP1166-20130328/5305_1 /TAXON_ID=1104430 /ORGANISM="Chrysoreinhardia sp, Strain CCMP3193" /LENGTH=340 /DNA_ID=CAMNT_0006837319 /DNA_START=37 /DNA_END=1059 /DNA_ORIENTATION=-